MISSDFRAEARRKLEGKWGRAALIVLAFWAVSFLMGIVQRLLPIWITTIVIWIIEIPLSFGLVYSLYNLFNDKDTDSFAFWNLGFNNFGRSWSITFSILAKMIVPIVIMVIGYILIAIALYKLSASSLYYLYTNHLPHSVASSGILLIVSAIVLLVGSIWATIKSYYYQLSYYISFENPDMLPKDCVARSEELMTNHRAKLFGLQLSFIGWAILGFFTLFIGYFWLVPYIIFTTIVFYNYLAHGDNGTAEVVNDTSKLDNAINIDNPVSSDINSDNDNPIQ